MRVYQILAFVDKLCCFSSHCCLLWNDFHFNIWIWCRTNFL